MEGLVLLLRVIIKSFLAGIMDVPVGMAAILIHTCALNLFFYFPTPLGLSNSSTGFGMSPVICGAPCPVTCYIIKSFLAGIMDIPVGMAAILIHTCALNLFFYFPTPLGLCTSSTGFDMSPIICGEPFTVTWGNH